MRGEKEIRKKIKKIKKSVRNAWSPDYVRIYAHEIAQLEWVLED